jgi:hypothetical protein
MKLVSTAASNKGLSLPMTYTSLETMGELFETLASKGMVTKPDQQLIML